MFLKRNTEVNVTVLFTNVFKLNYKKRYLFYHRLKVYCYNHLANYPKFLADGVGFEPTYLVIVSILSKKTHFN